MRIFKRFERATIFHPNATNCLQKTSGGPIYTLNAASQSQHICCMKEAPKYMTCDFSISIQWDGFIIRPDLWDDAFMQYDYIGCPWPLQNIVNPLHRVGSGGFCMWSKQFAQYAAEHGDESIPNDWEKGAVNRRKYEEAGFYFAPISLAAKFGKEMDLEDMDIKEGESFGFHGFQYNEGRKKYRDLLYPPKESYPILPGVIKDCTNEKRPI